MAHLGQPQGRNKMIKPFEAILLQKAVKGGNGGGEITPSGTVNLVKNGTYDVADFAKAVVSVPNVPLTDSFIKEIFAGNNVSIYDSTITQVNPEAITTKYLVGLDLPNCVSVYHNAFQNCKLSVVNLPAASLISDRAFLNNPIRSINASNVKVIGDYAFYNGIREIETLDFSLCTYIGDHAFDNCSTIKTFSLADAHVIGAYAFASCYNLTSLYLLGSYRCSLSNSNAFFYTPIAMSSYLSGTFGSIFVPASLYSSYITSSNWSYYSARFVSVA
jgi:hypothetical protein